MDSTNDASKYFQKTNVSIFDELTPKVENTSDQNPSPNPRYSLDTPQCDPSFEIYGPQGILTQDEPTSLAGYPEALLGQQDSEDFDESLLGASNRSLDAWLPCKETKNALANIQTNQPNPKMQLCAPAIVIKEDFGDPVLNLMQTYFGDEAATNRQSVSCRSVTQDERGLRQLIAAGAWHAAIHLCGQLLSLYGQGQGERRTGGTNPPVKHTTHSVQLWFTRLALLVKLRRFSAAQMEATPLGEVGTPDLYFQFYPHLYGGRKGAIAPFALRLLLAELPQYLGKHTETLDRLSKLLKICEEIENHLSCGLCEDGTEPFPKAECRTKTQTAWHRRTTRVLYALARCAIGIKDFRLSSSLLGRLLQRDPSASAGLSSATGRLYLHMGDVVSARAAFKRSMEVCGDPTLGLMQSALAAAASADFHAAADILQHANTSHPNNPLVCNNLSVCLVYLGRISEAVTLLEAGLEARPRAFLHEALVLNLCTMYELESSDKAQQNKLKILGMVGAHKGDGFNIAALKLQG